MQIDITFSSGDASRKVDLPIDYNYLVQGFIYHGISEELAAFLHDKGFEFEKRSFKMFTFSRLLGNCLVQNSRINFEGNIYLHVRSPVVRFVEELANSVLKSGEVVLGPHKLKVVGVNFPEAPKFGSEEQIRLLSAATVYSTLYTGEGRKKTYYYSPYEAEFSELVTKNAKKKHAILHDKNIGARLTVVPLHMHEIHARYQTTVVKGWLGTAILQGSKALIQTVYDTGLGSKNPQGFGMFDVVRNE